tara:strand:- start:1089 stop:1460 length:372 start_codon:yes stop_codon:yes gene_type:complete
MSLKMPRQWSKRVRVENEATELKQDKKDPIAMATTAAVIRAINEKDTEFLADLQVVGKMFNVSNPTPAGQTAMGRVTRTTLTDANGAEHVIDDDPKLVTSYTQSGMTITKTESCVLYDDGTVR